MSRMPKTLLWLSIACFVLGGAVNLDLINPRGMAASYIILPLGAVFFGLFLIVLMLQREGEKHQEDQHLSDPARGPAQHAPPRTES